MRSPEEKKLYGHSDYLSSLNKVTRYFAEDTKRTMKIVVCVFLVISTFVVYAQVRDHKLLNYDDHVYVTKYFNGKSGLTKENVEWAFTHSHYGAWIPITSLSYMLDYEFYGLHPKGYLFTNLFFHIANALLLFIILLRMTGSLWPSAFVAVVFALHPINVESVAWIAQRKNVLSTLFWLLTMWAYVLYVEKRDIKRYVLVILFFALGLMSKTMLVTLPFVLFLLDFWPLARFKLERTGESFKNLKQNKPISPGASALRLILEKLPLLILSVLASVRQVSETSAFNNCTSLMLGKQYINDSACIAAPDLFSLQARFTNGMFSYLDYLGKMVWPKGLAAFYPHPGDTLSVWKGVLCGMVLVGLTIIAIRLVKRAPYFAVGWFWYLGTLVPVIGIFKTIGAHGMADRYVYVPLMGVFIIIAWGLLDIFAEWRYKKKVFSLLAGVLIPTLMVTTWVQVSHWKNSVTIFKHAINVTDNKNPNLALIHNTLGMVFLSMGKAEEAVSHYKMAIELKPDLAIAYTNLGIARLSTGKTEEAISHYKKAIKVKPDHASGYYNLGIALSALGKTEEAISHYKTAIKLRPDYVEPRNNIGLILEEHGKTHEAISYYKTAIKLKPGYAAAYSNLGNALFTQKKIKEAISYHKTAIKLRPDFVPAHINLGNALFALGKTEEAISHYKKAIKLNPNFAIANSNLGNALFALGKTEEAISHYKKAIKLNPNFAMVYANLGNALSSLGETEKAIAHYKMSIKHKPDYIMAHHNLGVALFATKNFKEAIFHYKEAIKYRPNYPMAYTNLGNALFALDKAEKAVSQYKVAIKLKPDYAEAHQNLGNVLMQIGKIKEAIHHYNETLRLKPNFASAKKNLERALLLADKVKKSEKEPMESSLD